MKEIDPLEYMEEVESILKAMGQDPIGTTKAAQAAFTSAHASRVESRHSQAASHIGRGTDLFTVAVQFTSQVTERIRPSPSLLHRVRSSWSPNSIGL